MVRKKRNQNCRKQKPLISWCNTLLSAGQGHFPLISFCEWRKLWPRAEQWLGQDLLTLLPSSCTALTTSLRLFPFQLCLCPLFLFQPYKVYCFGVYWWALCRPAGGEKGGRKMPPVYFHLINLSRIFFKKHQRKRISTFEPCPAFLCSRAKSRGVIFKRQAGVWETSYCFSKVYCYFALLDTCREETVSV